MKEHGLRFQNMYDTWWISWFQSSLMAVKVELNFKKNIHGKAALQKKDTPTIFKIEVPYRISVEWNYYCEHSQVQVLWHQLRKVSQALFLVHHGHLKQPIVYLQTRIRRRSRMRVESGCTCTWNFESGHRVSKKVLKPILLYISPVYIYSTLNS